MDTIVGLMAVWSICAVVIRINIGKSKSNFIIFSL